MNVLPALFHLRPHVTGAVLARARLLTLMLMACLLGWFTLVPPALAGEPDPYVLETTPPGHGGGGLSVGSNLAGYTFRLTQRTQISEVGAQLHQYGTATRTVYIALYHTGTPISAPSALSDDKLIATALLTIDQAGSTTASAPLSATLDPGWYALVVGTGRHGATAPNFAVTLENTQQTHAPHLRGPYTVNATTDAISLQGTALRLFARGQTLPPTPPAAGQFHTAEPWARFDNGFWEVNASRFFAARFEVEQTLYVNRASAWLHQFNEGQVFVAILRLASAQSPLPAPGSTAFDNAVVATGLIDTITRPRDHGAIFDDVELTPGTYAVVMGSGGYGASGHASLMALDAADMTDVVWMWLPGSGWNSQFAKTQITLSGQLPRIEVTPDPLDFGPVPLGSDQSRVMTVRNLGDTPLTLSAIDLEGVDATRFQFGPDLDQCEGQTLAVAAECTFTLIYQPVDAGDHTATLRVVSDGVPGTRLAALSGTGVPVYTVSPSAGMHGTISPDIEQIVLEGTSISFLLTPDTGYRIADVAGSCGGSLIGHEFTTVPIVADCSVVASFARNPNSAPTLGLLGNLAYPAGSAGEMLVPEFAYVSSFGDAPWEVEQAVLGYEVEVISDPANLLLDAPMLTLDGSLGFALGGTRGSAQLRARVRDNGGTADGGVDVSAWQSFAITAGEGLDVAVRITHAQPDSEPCRYGDYTVVVENIGSVAASDVQVDIPPPTSMPDATWTCTPWGLATCPPSGNGPISHAIDLPLDSGVTYRLIGEFSLRPDPDELLIAHASATGDVFPENDIALAATTACLFSDGYEAAPMNIGEVGDPEATSD